MARARTRDYTSTAPAKSYSAPTGVAGPVGSRRATAEDFGGVGAGLVTAGKGLADFATELQKRQEQADVTRVSMMESKAIYDITESVFEARRTAQPGAPHHVDNVKGIVDKYFADEERLGTVTTAKGKSAYQKVAANVKSGFAVNAVKHAATASGKYVRAQYQDHLNTGELILLSNPSDEMLDQQIAILEKVVLDPEGAIATSKGLNAQDLKAMVYDGTEKFLTAQIQGRIRSEKDSEYGGPQQAIIDIDSGEYDDLVDKEKIKTLRNEAFTEIDRRRKKKSAIDTEAKKKLDLEVQTTSMKYYNMYMSGVDENEQPITLEGVLDRIMDDPVFSKKGVDYKHKHNLMNAITTRDQDESRQGARGTYIQDIGDKFLYEWTYGETRPVIDPEKSYMVITAAEGDEEEKREEVDWVDEQPVKVTLEDLKRAVMDSDLGAFSGPGNKKVFLELIRAKENNEAGYEEQERILKLVLSRTDPKGVILSNQAIDDAIRASTLKPSGTGSKRDFLEMNKSIIKDSTDLYIEGRSKKILTNMLLPQQDPEFMSSKQLMANAPQLIQDLGQIPYLELLSLSQAFEGVEAEEIKKEMTALGKRFASSITDATVFDTDPAGDQNYSAFLKFAMREVQAKQKARREGDAKSDWRILFDDTEDSNGVVGNKEWLGHHVKNYVPSLADRVKQADTVHGLKPFVPAGRPNIHDRDTALPNETIPEFEERRIQINVEVEKSHGGDYGAYLKHYGHEQRAQ